jgi:UDP-N-acetylmuramoylalanine--D-glutamate ligase
MKRLEGQVVVVVGMAKSGVAAVELLHRCGAKVVALDQKPTQSPALNALGVEVLPQSVEAARSAQLVVLSPGVPADCDVAQAARAAGVDVIGDLELASWFLLGRIIAITGANGKTTTTALTGHILQACGIAAQVGGNIGTPPCTMVATSRSDQWNVFELSSFQLETTRTFHAHIGAALNVTPDHLDRHYTFANYAAAKALLFRQQEATDHAVLNADDPTTRSYSTTGSAQVQWFSRLGPVERGAYVDRAALMLYGTPLMRVDEIPLRGAHNVENVLAAAVMAHLAGATHEQIRAAVMTFPGVEHRLEYVGRRDGVAWYNDSKATNVDAALKAIAAFDGGLWIILGGKDKGSDYKPLVAALAGKLRRVLLIGAAAPLIERDVAGLAPSLPMQNCETLAQAIDVAQRSATSGDTVLLAPACASFDQFTSYEHRGREFKRMAMELGVKQ